MLLNLFLVLFRCFICHACMSYLVIALSSFREFTSKRSSMYYNDIEMILNDLALGFFERRGHQILDKITQDQSIYGRYS